MNGISWRQAIGIPLNVLLFLLLMVMGWGSWAGFFAHPVRVVEGTRLHRVTGLSEFPVLVRNEMPPAPASPARHEMWPHCATVLASCTGAS